MFPFPSTAMPLPFSSLLPPSKVENKIPEPDAFNFVTKQSLEKDVPAPTYKIDPLVGWGAIARTDRFQRPVLAGVQFVPPFVVLIIPLLPTAAKTPEVVAAIALTWLNCGIPFVSGVQEVAPFVLLLIPPVEPWPV